jgi:large subunit ribosomal protein L22e
MVAIRKKVGARSQMKTPAMPKGKKIIKIDCATPIADGIFDDDTKVQFEEHFANNTKLHGRKGKLADKVKIAYDDSTLTISTTMKYRKKYFKYLTKKFLKKKSLRDWLRVLATKKDTYQLKYFNIQQDEEAEE